MLKEPSCHLGYTEDDLTEILGDREPEFSNWMTGQTAAICSGRRYHHDRKHDNGCRNLSPWMLRQGYQNHSGTDDFDWYCGYTGTGYYEDDDCAGNPHGMIVYRHDLERFLAGLPVID